MRFLAGLTQSTAEKTVPFHERSGRVKHDTSRLIRIQPCSSGVCQQLLGLMNALIRLASIPAAPVACGPVVTASFGRASFVPRPSRPPLKCRMYPEMGRMTCGDSLLCKRIKAGRRQPTRGPSISLSTLAIISLLSGCASAPLVEGGSLSSYQGLTPSDSKLKITKSRLHVSQEQVLAAKTINIVPTAFPPTVAPKLSDKQRTLVANAVDRALCVNLSDRFNVVALDVPADLTVRAAVTRVKETNEVTAGLSAAASIGSSFIDTSVPIPVPRIPIGLGSLSIEAEAVDSSGQQQAAMLWGRGATTFFSSPKVSKAGDAYDLADKFGDDFAHLLVKGKSPFKTTGIDIPSWQKVRSTMGFAPKYAACERFGRYPGIKGLVGDQIGLPPEWTDRSPKGTSRS